MNIKSTIKYILFDLDGTITDSEIGITKSIQYSLSKFDIKVDDLELLIPFIGPPLKRSFIERYDFSEENAELAVNYFREYFKERGMFENLPYKGVESTLRTLKGMGYKLAIATSKPTIFSNQILGHFNLNDYFEHIVGSNLNNTRTNKNEIITECLNLFDDSDKEKYIMVGDKEYDIMGAKKVGIKSIGVLYGYGSKKELTEAGADYIANSHTDIVDLCSE